MLSNRLTDCEESLTGQQIRKFLENIYTTQGQSDNTISAYRSDLLQLEAAMIRRGVSDFRDLKRPVLLSILSEIRSAGKVPLKNSSMSVSVKRRDL